MYRRTFLGGVVLAAGMAGSAWAKKAKPQKRRRSKRTPLPPDDDDASWQQLFDGSTLAGWESHFAVPKPGVGESAVARDVFSIVEEQGQKLLRVSGETFGALITTTSFANYHLRVQWRWGNDKWPPRAHLRRSSGIIVHSNKGADRFGEGKPWLPGLEFELQEGGCGDLWVGNGVRVDVPSRQARFMGAPLLMYTAGYPMTTVPAPNIEARVVKSNDFEKGFGEWNLADVYVFGGEAAFLTNGKLSMQWGNARTIGGGSETPLTEGPIQLASEGAEIHFRKVALQPLAKMPDRFRLPKAKLRID